MSSELCNLRLSSHSRTSPEWPLFYLNGKTDGPYAKAMPILVLQNTSPLLRPHHKDSDSTFEYLEGMLKYSYHCKTQRVAE